jgi:hypothetical protein
MVVSNPPAAPSGMPGPGMAGQAQVPANLHDIKPPVDIPNPWVWVWWTLGLLAAAAAGYWLWKMWREGRARGEYVPPVPPHVRAKQKLREALMYLEQPREFCIRVSDTIRAYLEERFDFHAPERTTEEFLHELQGTDLLKTDQKGSLAEFLNRCDLVKFAKYEPGEPELRDLHDSAVKLVEETEPLPEAPQVPGATAAPPPLPHSAPRTPNSALQ